MATRVLDLDVGDPRSPPLEPACPLAGLRRSWAPSAPSATAALAIAALAALESLLCATVADAMTVDEHHDPDRELFGQGLANMVVPAVRGRPATAAIARTAVNVRAGATSRLAAVTHSLVLLALVFVAAPLVSGIPLAALAGVLFATCVRMVEAGALRALLRSTRSDAVIVALTFTVTVALDLVTAVGVGVGVAVVLALRAVARTASIEQVPLDSRRPQRRGARAAQRAHRRLPHRRARSSSPPPTASCSSCPTSSTSTSSILRMSRVTTLDATGANVLDDAITRLERRGIVVLLSGVAPSTTGAALAGLRRRTPRRRSHPARHPDRDRSCATTPHAGAPGLGQPQRLCAPDRLSGPSDPLGHRQQHGRVLDRLERVPGVRDGQQVAR